MFQRGSREAGYGGGTGGSIARRTLETARFFLDQAESVGPGDRRALEHFLEAAIVFGRSVTFHLQRQFAGRAGFKEWYTQKQTEMANDPLLKFFKDKRNYILKEGPITIQKTVAIAITETIAVSAFVEARVIRGNPWFRRSPGIWLEDSRAAIGRLASRWRQKRQLARRRKQSQRATPTRAQERLHFEEPEWRERGATELLREYFAKLERLVENAEARFA